MHAFAAPARIARVQPLHGALSVTRVAPRRHFAAATHAASSSSRASRLPSSSPSPSPCPLASASTSEPVVLIDGTEAYLAALACSQHTLVVLKLFAPWCRSCRALAPRVRRLAREFDNVRFFQMDVERNRELCAQLGVRSMPTFILYRGEAGEVAKFSCGPRRAGVLRRRVQQCVDGFCSLHDGGDADGGDVDGGGGGGGNGARG